jgi:hypothetical protein
MSSFWHFTYSVLASSSHPAGILFLLSFLGVGWGRDFSSHLPLFYQFLIDGFQYEISK